MKRVMVASNQAERQNAAYEAERAYKSAIERHIASARYDASSVELARLHATSVTLHSCAMLRAETVSMVPMVVKNPAGEVAPEHPAQKIFNDGQFSDRMHRTELSMFYWGHSLLYKEREPFPFVSGLRWLNPRNYDVLTNLWSGLDGFRVYASVDKEEVGAEIQPFNAIYMHGVDFEDDYDGVSPAEVAFLSAQVEPEIAMTQLALFRNLAIPAAIAQPAADSKAPTETQAKNLRDMLRNAFQGAANFARTLVLPVRWEILQLMMPFKDILIKEQAEEARLGVAIASRVPLELIVPSAGNFAQFEGARRQWGHSWVVPRAMWYARQFTDQLLAEWGPGWTVEPDFSDVAFLKEDMAAKTTVITAQVTAGTMSLYNAQVELGQDPDDALKDLYVFQGVPVPKHVLSTLWERVWPDPAAAQPGGFGGFPSPPAAPDGMMSLEDAAKPHPFAPRPVEAGKSAAKPSKGYACLTLGAQKCLTDVQEALKEAVGDVPVDWEDPAQFHVTLVYGHEADDDQLAGIARGAKNVFGGMFSFKCRGLTSFEPHDGKKAVVLMIDPNAALQQLQSAIYDLFSERGIEISEYSHPDAYNPHVTLGYFPADAPIPDIPVDLTAWAEVLDIDRDDYEVFERIEAEAPFDYAYRDAADTELKTARHVLGRKGRQHPFEFRVIHNDAVRMTRHYLSTATELDEVFAGARALTAGKSHKLADQWRAAKAQGDLADVFAATPEQILQWWSAYEDLLEELGDTWLEDYMARVWSRVQGSDFTEAQIMSALDVLDDELVETWTGTTDKPGPVLKLLMAGIGAGNEAMRREIAANPEKAVKAATAVKLEIDWNVTSTHALERARTYSYDLIRGLNRTTTRQVRQSMSDWLRSKESMDSLTERMKGIFNDPKRARLIAQTESTRIYNQGAMDRWNGVGVKRGKFQTVRDKDVCPICKPLHNTTADLSIGWDAGKGRFAVPPMHPGCRCFMRPLVSDVSVEEAAETAIPTPPPPAQGIVPQQGVSVVHSGGQTARTETVTPFREVQVAPTPEPEEQGSPIPPRSGAETMVAQQVVPEEKPASDDKPKLAKPKASTPGWLTRGQLRQTSREVFGRELSAEDIAQLSGGHDGMTINVYVQNGRFYMDAATDDASYDTGIAVLNRMVSKDKDGVFIENQYFRAFDEKQKAGVGWQTFQNQVNAAREQGVTRLLTHSAGDWQSRADWNGYYTWPRFGYDAELPYETRSKLPASLASATHVLDLMKTKKGRDWWKRNGHGLHLTFDLREGSRSMRVFEKYTKERAKRG